MTKNDIDKITNTFQSGKLYFLKVGVLVVCLSHFDLNCVTFGGTMHKNMNVKGDLS